MNQERYVQELPYDSAFHFLPDAELESVDSYEALSVYSFRCGCAVVRFIDIEDCRVKWCERHRPRSPLRSV
jgi:hypothetical protein